MISRDMSLPLDALSQFWMQRERRERHGGYDAVQQPEERSERARTIGMTTPVTVTFTASCE